MLKKVLAKLVKKEDLSFPEMVEAVQTIMRGEATEGQIGAFLTGLHVKGETAEEIKGAVTVMRQNATPIPAQRPGLVDTCGTGGDASGTFNISTTAAFIAAGAGVPVAKHGNRALSSRCGSADVLEALGVKIDLPPAAVGRCIDEVGLGFMFAPLLHQATRHVMPVRKALGFRTIFNILGPLTNPAGARRQIMGVFEPALCHTLAQVLVELGAEHVLVVYGNGIDELSTNGQNLVAEGRPDGVQVTLFQPENAGLPPSRPEDLAGGDAARNASILREILDGAPGRRADIALLNAGAAIYVGGKAASIKDGLEKARVSVSSGAARKVLEELVKFTKG
jgi:anthranilate phosphoribosyltransferase